MIKKRFLGALIAVAVALGATATSASAAVNGSLKISGSTALQPLVQQAANEFKKKNPGVTISISGGGSGTGLKQVRDGSVDIGMSDVFDSGTELVDNQIAIIPFIFIVNPDTGVKNLTQKQATDVFSGKVTNWKEVGGKDKKIAVIMRAASSGTRMTIQQVVMGDNKFTEKGVVQASSKAVAETVAKTSGSIGYVDLVYANSKVKTVSYNGVVPSVSTAANGSYKITSIGHLYTKGTPSGVEKEFINYIKSAEFQKRVVTGLKFAPIDSSAKSQVKKVKLNIK